MRRIIVVGSQGSGKTSFALKLGRKLGLPVVHLDVLYGRPGWKAFRQGKLSLARCRAQSRATVGSSTAASRGSLSISLWRGPIPWSSSTGPGGRASGASLGALPLIVTGCGPTCLRGALKFDWNLLREAWRYNAERRPAVEAERLMHGAEVPAVHLNNDREIDHFVHAISRA
jgi:hypothetical protein